MKKTFIPLLVVASIALLFTGCCLGKEDEIHEPDQKYLIKYGTLVYKAENGRLDTFQLIHETEDDRQTNQCYYEVWKNYIYRSW